MANEVMRTKVLCDDGKMRTFTQRGRSGVEGFVRVDGRTVTGFIFSTTSGPHFAAFRRCKNYKFLPWVVE